MGSPADRFEVGDGMEASFGSPQEDELSASIRPQSVPSWLAALKGRAQPGVPSLPPRANAEHLVVDPPSVEHYVSRPRAPIVGVPHVPAWMQAEPSSPSSRW